MRFKAILTVSLALLMAFSLATPALAAKAAAIGKLSPGDLESRTAGRYVFTTYSLSPNLETVELFISARKLEPNTTYQYGFTVLDGGAFDRIVSETVSTNSHGQLKCHIESTDDWTGNFLFAPFVNTVPDPVGEPYILYGPAIGLPFP